jgi:SH3-like domain-containing protein
MKKRTVTFLTLGLVAVFASVVFAERLTVKVPVANVRSGPNTKSDILWNVEQYHPLDVIKTTGSWYQFKDFEGDKGWIHKSLLDKTPAVITIRDKCNVRLGPSTKKEIFFTVDKGIPFKVLKRQGDWVYIQHSDGDKGWIHKSLVW